MIFARERFSARLRGEIYPLLVEHHREIERYQDIPLDPDWDMYEGCDNGGLLRIFTMRYPNDDLAGYAVFYVRTHMHYRHCLQAIHDVLYIAPSVRRGLQGYKFIQWCDKELKAEGVKVVYQATTERRDFGRLLERAGYQKADTIYARRLDKIDNGG